MKINILVSIIISIFSTICYNICYIKLNQYKIKINIKNVISIIIASILILLNNGHNNLWLKVIITPMIFFISLKIIYKDEIKKIIINYIMIYIIMIMIEIILTNILYKIGIIENNNGVILYSVSKFILSIIIGVIECMIFSIKKINKRLKRLRNFFIENINTLNIAYLWIITYIIIGIINIENFAKKGTIELVMLLFFLFFLMFVIIIKSKTKEEYLKKSNNKLIEYNDKYGKFLDEYKVYKHNIKNKLIGMKAFGNKKINALIDDLLEEETKFSIKNNNLYNVPNGIKGIVAEKLYNTKINVIIDNKLKKDPFIKLNPKEFNKISESIGVCIDNAIEASIETENPIITIDLYEDRTNNYIKIGNNFKNEIDIEEIGEKNYSTKNRGSGYGLFSIMRNKFVKEKITIINDFYYIELAIKKHAD